MVQLTEEVRSFICRHRAYAFTVGADGVPNIKCYENITVSDDGSLELNGRHSPKNMANLQENPVITLTVLEPKTYCGYQISGRVKAVKATAGEQVRLSHKDRRQYHSIRIAVEQIRLLKNKCSPVRRAMSGALQ